MEDKSGDKEVVWQVNSYLNKTGMKQYELAAEIGAPVQTVNRWLTGKSKVSRAYKAILKTKGILPVFLLTLFLTSGCNWEDAFAKKERYKLLAVGNEVFRLDTWNGGTEYLERRNDPDGTTVASWHAVIETDPKVVEAIKKRLLDKYGSKNQQ